MSDLVTDTQFSVWWGVACAVWTGGWVIWARLFGRKSGLFAAVAGPVAYLLWLGYGAVAPRIGITRVSGVLVLAIAFALLGSVLGWVLSRSSRR